jgi:hypothetical protein
MLGSGGLSRRRLPGVCRRKGEDLARARECALLALPRLGLKRCQAPDAAVVPIAG